jgi:phosphatidylglycerol phospholipase C
MAAFRAAAKVGAHAIETDLHLSRDGVVVLSHVQKPNLGLNLTLRVGHLFYVGRDPESMLWR